MTKETTNTIIRLAATGQASLIPGLLQFSELQDHQLLNRELVVRRRVDSTRAAEARGEADPDDLAMLEAWQTEANTLRMEAERRAKEARRNTRAYDCAAGALERALDDCEPEGLKILEALHDAFL